ncbi:uncharacterized protein MONOS_17838 [Monocercomonoides exilis]|uniref:uncharacterized protein n=1 Tax=Monocercomonoides exilis TaxID=2049356 RepID=UPI003559D386|nr:hypothetical protein MONOS_17838 [Monocercomonoides exilis]
MATQKCAIATAIVLMVISFVPLGFTIYQCASVKPTDQNIPAWGFRQFLHNFTEQNSFMIFAFMFTVSSVILSFMCLLPKAVDRRPRKKRVVTKKPLPRRQLSR